MRALAISGLVLGCLTGVSRAGTDTKATEVDASVDRARELAARAQEHFDLGEYRAAIGDFRDAYRLYPTPGFLYNLAQSYRLMGDCVSASTMYRNYLRLAPQTKIRGLVKRHLASLDACVRERERSEQMRAELRPGRATKRAGMAFGGTGMAMAGVGAWLVLRPVDPADPAQRNRDDDDIEPGNDDEPQAEPSHRQLATALIAGGVVATAAGAALYYLGWRDEHRSASFTVVPVSHGAAVSVGWRF